MSAVLRSMIIQYRAGFTSSHRGGNAAVRGTDTWTRADLKNPESSSGYTGSGLHPGVVVELLSVMCWTGKGGHALSRQAATHLEGPRKGNNVTEHKTGAAGSPGHSGFHSPPRRTTS